MGDQSFQFGLTVDSVIDPETYEQVDPRIFGEGRLSVKNPAVFAAASAAPGGEAAIVATAQALVGKHLGAAIRAVVDAGTPLSKLLQKTPEVCSAAVAKVNDELRAAGAVVQIGSFNLNFSDGDRDRLKGAVAALAAERSAKPQAVERPGPLASGTHVDATWTDGRSYPGTVRGFNGTHYEVVWDGSASSAWVPPAMLKAR
jgi:hypothetical protein